MAWLLESPDLMHFPFLNSSQQIGQLVDKAKLDYVGGNRKIPRARFTLSQERPRSIDTRTQGKEVIAIPCEVHGSRAEDFVRTFGKNSILVVQGWWRSYDMMSAYPKMRLVVDYWNLIDQIMPLRGIGKRKSIPDVPEMAGLPDDDEAL